MQLLDTSSSSQSAGGSSAPVEPIISHATTDTIFEPTMSTIPLQAESEYKFSYPAGLIPDSLIKFIQHFYAVTDRPDSYDEYASLYTPDAILEVASMAIQGRSEIRAFSEKAWEGGLLSRFHIIGKVFPYPSEDPEKEVEVMLYGISKFEFANGHKGVLDWGARARFVNPDGNGWKNGEYRVYLDTQKSALQKANEKFGPPARMKA